MSLFTGEYLALTGEKLNGAEMFACGLATHYAHSSVNSGTLFLISYFLSVRVLDYIKLSNFLD